MMKFQIAFWLMFVSFAAQAQKNKYTGFPSTVWPRLYDIQFVKAKDNLGEFDKPVFSAGAKSLDGKVVTLPGYIVPFETGVKSTHLMLSALPLSACYFCGGGGPETVVEVYLKKEINYTEKPVEIKGVLRLNATNPDKMIYVLETAELIGEIGF